MRYFTKEDLDSDALLNLTYTSSRLMYEDIQSSMIGVEDKKLDNKSENNDENITSDRISSVSNRLSSPSLSTTTSKSPSSSTSSTNKTRSKSLKDNSEKLIPSFFSRTYVSWVLLTEKMAVYTPVRIILFIYFY